MIPARLSLLACLLAAACQAAHQGGAHTDGSSARAPVEFATVARGDQSGFAGPARMVIRTREGWSVYWSRHAANRLPPPPCPEIDFARDMVVVLSLGERPSAGYAVEVHSVEREGAFLRVQARERKPAPGTGQAAVVTHPFHIVRLPRSAGPVEIVVK